MVDPLWRRNRPHCHHKKECLRVDLDADEFDDAVGDFDAVHRDARNESTGADIDLRRSKPFDDFRKLIETNNECIHDLGQVDHEEVRSGRLTVRPAIRPELDVEHLKEGWRDANLPSLARRVHRSGLLDIEQTSLLQ